MSLSASFPTIGTLDTTLPSTSDPAYQLASLALDVHKIIKNLSDEGFVFRQAEASDFTAWEGSVTDALDDYIERYEDILQSGFSEVVANLPDVISIMGAIVSGGGEGVISILLQGILDVILRHKDTRSDYYNGDTAEVDTAALVAKLDDLIDAIYSILTTFNINLYAESEEANWSVGPVTES